MQNLVAYNYRIKRQAREAQKNQHAKVVWFTGLSGSGKSTLANALDQRLTDEGYHTYVLDGDNIRQGINNNLTFSQEDRTENIRRIAEIAKLFADAGIIVICAFISPLRSDRQMAKEIVGEEDFVEVHVSTTLEVCENRDVKGLYKKARRGEIKQFTGIDAPYEAPLTPKLQLDTSVKELEDSVEEVVRVLL